MIKNYGNMFEAYSGSFKWINNHYFSRPFIFQLIIKYVKEKAETI